MPFEMETSRTADAAKLAVLWRDRGKQPPAAGGGGYGVPDHFVEDVFEGGILDQIVPPPAGPPTTNPDGSTTQGVPPEPTLVNHKTPFTDAKAPKLLSLYAAVQELRRIIASPEQPGPTDPLYPLTEEAPDGEQPPFGPSSPYYGDGIRSTIADVRALTHGKGSVFGGPDGFQDRVEALREAQTSILDILLDLREFTFGFFGPDMTESISDWIDGSSAEEDLPGIRSGLIHLLKDFNQRLAQFETQVLPKLETAQRDIVYAENRIRRLEDDYTSLSQRVGVLESGTGGQ